MLQSILSLTPEQKLVALVLHCLIGALAAAIAGRKGYGQWRWILIGQVGGTLALIAAIRLNPSLEVQQSRDEL